jgi:uncharacterized GH25 family protein
MLKKISLSLLLLSSGMMVGVNAFAHQAYLAPLAHHVEGDHVLLHAGYTEDLFVPEFPLKGSFFIVDTQGQKSELSSVQALKSATIIEAELKEKGTYKILTENERDSVYAEQKGKWLTVRDVPASEAPAADKRKYLLTSEVGNSKTTTSKIIAQIVTYVSKDEATDGALVLTNQGLELRFAVNPTQINSKDGLVFDVLLNGKPVEGVTFEIHQAGEEHTDHDDEKPEQTYNSDIAGKVTVPLAQAGDYLLTTKYPQVKAGDKPAAVVYQYVLSFAAK